VKWASGPGFRTWGLPNLWVLLFYTVLHVTSTDAGPRYETRVEPPRTPFKFALVGDTRPSIEILGASSGEERRAVAAEIARRRPAFVINSGDLVFDGGSPRAWAVFDSDQEPIRAARIPYRPVWGNHEYFSSLPRARRYFADRFGELPLWHAFDAGPLRLVGLDSNESQLTPSQRREQETWLRRTLEDAEADPSIRWVGLYFHHPPFTNCTHHAPSAHARAAFFEGTARFRKARLFMVGHVHSYERFLLDGRTLIVSGGGGAPLFGVETDPAKWLTRPEYRGPRIRPYHFVEIEVRDDRLRGEMWEMADGGWALRDTWEIGP
jgi:hypothetical protein